MRQLLLSLTFLASTMATGATWAQIPDATPAAPQSTPQANVPPPVTAPVGGQVAGPAPATAANTIRQNVSLVVLDGVALDAKGKPVLDLTKDDFHVYEDDSEQTIRRFEVPGRFKPPVDADIESTAELDRVAPQAPVNIVLLDEFNTRFEDMAFARYSLKKWLDKQPGKLDEPTMLIAVSIDKFQVVRDYTQNKQLLLDALDHHFVAYPWQVHNFGWLAERYSTAFITLRRIAEATGGHPGHKNMIWLGRGFPNINFVNAGVDGERQVHSAIQLTVNELRDARVTLYTIDPAGVMTDPGKYGNAAAWFSPFGGEPNFEGLSRATGGRPLHGRNDVDTEIGTAINDGASLYSFSYRPTNTEWQPDKFRRIRVTINRPGVTFVTREGYYPQVGPARPGKDGQMGRRLGMELAAATQSNMVYDAVPFTVQTAPTDANDWHVRIEGKGLAWYFATDQHPRVTRLIVIVTTYDKKGKLLKEDAKRLEFTAPPSAPPTGRYDAAVGFPYKLAPDAKAVRARVVVRVEASGHMGTVDLQLAPGAKASTGNELTPASAPVPPPVPAAQPVASPPGA